MRKERFEPKLELPARSRNPVDPAIFDSGMASTPMALAMTVADEFTAITEETDPLGMWTGKPRKKDERPIQDADDI